MDYIKREDLGKYEQKILEMAGHLEGAFWGQFKQDASNIPDIQSAQMIMVEAAKHSLVWMSMKYILGFDKLERLAIFDQFVQHLKLNLLANLNVDYEEDDT